MSGRWQFSLSSLMLFTTAFAVWLSEMTLTRIIQEFREFLPLLEHLSC